VRVKGPELRDEGAPFVGRLQFASGSQSMVQDWAVQASWRRQRHSNERIALTAGGG